MVSQIILTSLSTRQFSYNYTTITIYRY